MRSENVLALSSPNCIPNCSDRVQLKFNANPRKAERNQWKGGGRTRARTWDPLIKSQLLYQLSYAPGPHTWGSPKPAGLSNSTPHCPAIMPVASSK